jgi:GNAT superfamily N-acetyltransferase
MTRFREIDSTPVALVELAHFYHEVYVAEFPDPDERESLMNMKGYLAAKARGWYGKNNYHIVVAEIDGVPVGGAVIDYLAKPNVGVIEFLFLGKRHRGKGLGHALLKSTIRLLRADARERTGRPLAAIVAEMNDPFRRPDTPDKLDPFERSVIWGRWGFGRLGFRYVQPALSPRQKPVQCLVLIARMLARPHAASVPADWVRDIVAEYMRWAMRIDAPHRNAQYREMAAFLAARRRVSLTPLLEYVGRDPARAFEVEPIGGPGTALLTTLAVLHRAIPFAGRVASARQFEDSLVPAQSRARHYRLWALRGEGSSAIDGLASFFALAPCGFGGYIVLDGPLQGRRLLRLLIPRIEEQMMRDSATADGWFIECGDESQPPFLRVGFREVPVEYRPPAVGDAAGDAVRNGPDEAGRIRAATGGLSGDEPERLHLLYKRFGEPFESPVIGREFLLDSIAAILLHVYRVAVPRRHPSYLRVREGLTRDERVTLQPKSPR